MGSGDTKIYALNATTGALLWDGTTSSFISSSPAFADGVIYVGSYNQNVYAFALPVGTATRTQPQPGQVRPAAQPETGGWPAVAGEHRLEPAHRGQDAALAGSPNGRWRLDRLGCGAVTWRSGAGARPSQSSRETAGQRPGRMIASPYGA